MIQRLLVANREIDGVGAGRGDAGFGVFRM